MTADAALYLGLISGTSADGIDVALASFAPAPKLHAALTQPYPQDLRRRILDLAQGDGRIDARRTRRAGYRDGRAFAGAALRLLAEHGLAAGAVSAIGSHGQTVRHRPAGATPYTLQLGDPNVIAEATGIATVADFRRRDMAAGGQGAPLAPAFHAAMLGSGTPRVVVNLGGIANITVLSGNSDGTIVGFDTGPASCLLDAWAEMHLGQPFDRDGMFAASGSVDRDLLARMQARSVLRGAATEEHRARGIPSGMAAAAPGHQRNRARGCAGNPARAERKYHRGSHRQARREYARSSRLRRRRSQSAADGGACVARWHRCRCTASPTRGIDPDFVEAMLFAWLARERLLERPAADVARVTGARGARVLGGIYFGG